MATQPAAQPIRLPRSKHLPEQTPLTTCSSPLQATPPRGVLSSASSLAWLLPCSPQLLANYLGIASSFAAQQLLCPSLSPLGWNFLGGNDMALGWLRGLVVGFVAGEGGERS